MNDFKKLEIGDTLISINDRFLRDSNEQCFTKNKTYTIVKIHIRKLNDIREDCIYVIDDLYNTHGIRIKNLNKWFYSKNKLRQEKIKKVIEHEL